MKKLLLFLFLVLIACVLAVVFLRKDTLPQVRFTQVKRQTMVSTVPTNGKVEPYEWQAVNTETAGLVSRVDVQNGQRVAAGAVMVEVSDPTIKADIDSASARLAEAQASLAELKAGGKASAQNDLENNLARARFNLETAQREHDSLERLVGKQAATPMEERTAADKVRQAQIEIDGLVKRRAALVSKTEVDAAQARVDAAEVALRLSKERLANTQVQAPIAGEVYGLAVRPGAYLKVGDLVANLGTLDRLRVRVYVDEPLLGRVKLGQPVTIRWDALPGKTWSGAVDKMPASIQSLGARQVGEVVCAIENPGRDLIPGNNVDAEITTATADGALAVPKETLRHDAQGDYVFLLHNGVVERRNVKLGISNVTQAQIVDGLSEGDSIALPSDAALKPGERVQAVP